MDRPSDDELLSYLDAACSGDLRGVKAFLHRFPAEIDAHPWFIETTALIEAAARGRRTVVELLLERGANPTLKNFDGETAAILAKRGGFDDIAALIVTAAPSETLERLKKKSGHSVRLKPRPPQ